MIRTQIYLDDHLISSLRAGAKLNKTTVSRYIRDLLNDKIKITNKKAKNPMKELIKIANSMPKTGKKTRLSMEIDKYLPENLR